MYVFSKRDNSVLTWSNSSLVCRARWIHRVHMSREDPSYCESVSPSPVSRQLQVLYSRNHTCRETSKCSHFTQGKLTKKVCRLILSLFLVMVILLNFVYGLHWVRLCKVLKFNKVLRWSQSQEWHLNSLTSWTDGHLNYWKQKGHVEVKLGSWSIHLRATCVCWNFTSLGTLFFLCSWGGQLTIQ